MTKKIAITFPEWVLDEIIGKQINRSAKIEELIIKGYMSEKFQAKNEDIKDKNALNEFLARNLNIFARFPKYSL